MKIIYKILTVILLLFASQAFSQAYVKFEETPPMEIGIKETRVKNIKIKYNVPSKGQLYLTLLKDGKAIGNSTIEVTRGKRVVNCTVAIWDGKLITKKGKYEYRLQVLKGKKDWNNVIAKATPITGVKAVKKKKE